MKKYYILYTNLQIRHYFRNQLYARQHDSSPSSAASDLRCAIVSETVSVFWKYGAIFSTKECDCLETSCISHHMHCRSMLHMILDLLKTATKNQDSFSR